MNIATRDGEEKDWGYVISTWIRTFPLLGDREARKNHMRRALRRGKLKVVCSDEDQDTLIGWSLFEENDLIWCYVAKDFRGIGLGKTLANS